VVAATNGQSPILTSIGKAGGFVGNAIRSEQTDGKSGKMRLISDDSLAIVTIWQEARNQSYEGKCAVGEVIRKRAATRYNSDGTIVGTVLRRYQFSGWEHGDPNFIPSFRIDDSDPIVKECKEAWLNSVNTNYSLGAVLYYNPQIVTTPPSWATADNFLIRIGDHEFFRG
jgi:spore germination cell wall hydrolase CwlJ-like protein